ncbi:unnamed protein product [Phytophthora fragariaefolia]|uniref:Unnamed protein product n=1 Tax=Phytophthora fragariaefolia TaxID=1490495 RepID=A0A9W6YI32_9STRA|nr:unnamed protein product [Phytophthora fragariaefolia]
MSDHKLVLQRDTKIAMWLTGDRVPRLPGYVSVESRRYAEWQNLDYPATTDEDDMTPKQEEIQGPAVERPLYPTPTSILMRPSTCPLGTAAARQINGGRSHDVASPAVPKDCDSRRPIQATLRPPRHDDIVPQAKSAHALPTP